MGITINANDSSNGGPSTTHTRPTPTKQQQPQLTPPALPSTESSHAYTLALSFITTSLTHAYDSGSTLNLSKLKSDAARRYKLDGIPRLSDILSSLPISHRNQLLPFLRSKPVRTASGVAIVAVMSKPHRCPHINYTNGHVCVYCLGGADSDFEYSTQAYTGYEPTSMRAIRARYDPFSQIKGRVAQLRNIGHVVDKVEFIVMGGTFMSLDKSYKDYFIRNLHDALSGHHSTSVPEAIRYSEQATTKCIGITIETRPDYCLNPTWTKCWDTDALELKSAFRASTSP